MCRKFVIIQLCLLFVSLFSCKEGSDLSEADGTLNLSIGVSDKVNVVSRSLSEETEAVLSQDCKVRIYSGETLVQKYQGIDQVPSQIQLASGDYSVRVTAGDSVAASFDKRFFEGRKEFRIEKGAVSNVEVNCGIANTVVAIVWDESLKQVFNEDYQVTVTSSTGELVYSSTNADAKGYFSLPEDDRKLTCKFTATTLGGKSYESSSELSDLNPATLYNLTYSYKEMQSGPTGGAALNIEVEDVPLGDTYTITLKQRPVIVCKDAEEQLYDLEHPLYLELNTQADYDIQVSTSASLASLVFQNDRFTDWGGSGNQLDVVTLDEQGTETWKSFGISIEKTQGSNGDVWTIHFSSELIAKMTASEGSVETTIEAVDAEKKSRKVVWTIVASDATVRTDAVEPYEVWTSKATLHGTALRKLSFTPGFRYRVKGSTEWTRVSDIELPGESFSKEITGLTPGTTYEYQAMDGEQASSVTCEFTTEVALRLPNASFESWSGDSPKHIYADGEDMFWDSGNEGASTLGGNITLPDETYKHSGKYSAKLKSQVIVTQFAAGNIFIGKYLKTEMDGFTGHGVLGFGRSFTSRPKALRGYIRYESGVVNKGGNMISKGQQDIGIIYIALTSGDGESYDDGSTWSCIVRTKNQKYFDKNATNIIAYGEQTWENSTSGNGMIEFTIPIDYRKLDEVPNRIVLVAAASKFGDYFQGSSGSTMWLDDVELIYE